MAGAVGAAVCLLLWASITQGVEMGGHEVKEAVEGQNVTLRCIIESPDPDLKIVSMEWTKGDKNNTKLALHSSGHGFYMFWSNVTMTIEDKDPAKAFGSYLNLPAVRTWDSGTYICDIATFPSGSIRRETELTVDEVLKIVCDVSEPVDVHVGENVTIHCSTSRNAQYRWTKNNVLVSANESLQLWLVTDSDSGVYTLTVSRGNESLHQHFTITVQIETASMSPGLTSTSTTSYVSTEGLTTEINIISTTSQTTGLQTTDAPVTRTTSSFTDTTDEKSTSAGNMTTNTNYTHDGVTSSPNTHTDPNNFNYSSSTQQTARDEPMNTTTSQTLRPSVSFSNKTDEPSTSGNVTKTTTLGAGTDAGVEESSRSHVVVLILTAALVLIIVAGFLYRRHVITKRMSLPPPFKPPPPPVKYTAARHRDISMQSFPISRCNSLSELKTHEANIQ